MTQLHALALTLGIEGAVGAGLLRGWLGWRGAPLLRAVLVVLAASLLTHPLAWNANRAWLVALSFPLRAAIIESTVTLAEAAILRHALRWASTEGHQPVSWTRCLVLSVMMNGASFGYGLLRSA